MFFFRSIALVNTRICDSNVPILTFALKFKKQQFFSVALFFCTDIFEHKDENKLK